MNVLCVVAHPDDEVIGVGGTLARHAADGDAVAVCVLSDGVTARHDEITPAVQSEIDRRTARIRTACERLGVEAVDLHEFADQQFDAVPLLKLVQTVEKALDQYDPDIVYTHHPGDLNADHELTARAVVTATRPLPAAGVDEVHAFETLSATEWSVPTPDNAFQPTTFVGIGEFLDAKIDALSTYEDELRTPPHPRSIETVRRNAHVWGSKAGLDAAEPFETLRQIRQ